MRGSKSTRSKLEIACSTLSYLGHVLQFSPGNQSDILTKDYNVPCIDNLLSAKNQRETRAIVLINLFCFAFFFAFLLFFFVQNFLVNIQISLGQSTNYLQVMIKLFAGNLSRTMP